MWLIIFVLIEHRFGDGLKGANQELLDFDNRKRNKRN